MNISKKLIAAGILSLSMLMASSGFAFSIINKNSSQDIMINTVILCTAWQGDCGYINGIYNNGIWYTDPNYTPAVKLRSQQSANGSAGNILPLVIPPIAYNQWGANWQYFNYVRFQIQNDSKTYYVKSEGCQVWFEGNNASPKGNANCCDPEVTTQGFAAVGCS